MAFVAYHSTTRMAARWRRARSSAMATRQLSVDLRLYRVYVSPAGKLVGCDFRFGPMLSKKSKSGRARIFCKTPKIRKLPTRSPVALTRRALQCTIENSGTPSAKFGYYDCTASKIHELPPQKPFSTASAKSGTLRPRNFIRDLALPNDVKQLLLTTPKERSIKFGANVVRYERHIRAARSATNRRLRSWSVSGPRPALIDHPLEANSAGVQRG